MHSIMQGLPFAVLEIALVVEIVLNPRIRKYLFSLQGIVLVAFAAWYIHTKGQLGTLTGTPQKVVEKMTELFSNASPFITAGTGAGLYHYWKRKLYSAVFRVFLAAGVAGMIYLVARLTGFI